MTTRGRSRDAMMPVDLDLSDDLIELRYEHPLLASRLVDHGGDTLRLELDLPAGYPAEELNAFLAVQALLRLDAPPAAVEAGRAVFEGALSPTPLTLEGEVADEFAWGMMLAQERAEGAEVRRRGRALFHAVAFGEAPDEPLVSPSDDELAEARAFYADQQAGAARVAAALNVEPSTIDCARDPRRPKEPRFPARLTVVPVVNRAALAAATRRMLASHEFGALREVERDGDFVAEVLLTVRLAAL